MVVTHLDTGVDASHLHVEEYPCFLHLVEATDDASVELLELPVHKGDATVLHFKVHRGVGRVNLVMRLSRKSENGKEGDQ